MLTDMGPGWQLGILAGTEQGGIITGQVLVNGRPLHASTFRKLSTYVPQQDVLLATATVMLLTESLGSTM